MSGEKWTEGLSHTSCKNQEWYGHSCTWEMLYTISRDTGRVGQARTKPYGDYRRAPISRASHGLRPDGEFSPTDVAQIVDSYALPCEVGIG